MYQNLTKIGSFALLSMLVLPRIVFADVAKIVFTTDSQTIVPNPLSGAITIQTQDGGGKIFQTPETLDLTFKSSSPTGEFLSSSGKLSTKTMNKNTGNRSVYYKDSAEGVFEIVITATGRESKKIWTASQNLTVSSGNKTPEPKPEPKVETKKIEPKVEEKPTSTPVITPAPAATSVPVIQKLEVKPEIKPEVKPEVKQEIKPEIKTEKKAPKQAAAVILSAKKHATSTIATSSTSTAVIYESPKKEGFFSKLWKFLKELFG